MIRSGKYTIYNDREYRVVKKASGEIRLLSESADDLKNGFRLHDNLDNLYIKTVEYAELSEVYYINSYAVYKGYKMQVDNSKDGLLILNTSNLKLVSEHEFIQNDRDNCYKLVKPDEVDEIIEEKEPVGNW